MPYQKKKAKWAIHFGIAHCCRSLLVAACYPQDTASDIPSRTFQ